MEVAKMGENKGLLLGLGVFIAVAVVGGVFVLTRNKPGNSAPSPSAEAFPPKTEVATEAASLGEAKEITVAAKEFSYSPSSFSLVKGEKVRIVFRNEGGMSHDFVIEGLNLKTKIIGPGQEDSFEFTPAESGTLTYYCSVGNHRRLGMEGKMEVK